MSKVPVFEWPVEGPPILKGLQSHLGAAVSAIVDDERLGGKYSHGRITLDISYQDLGPNEPVKIIGIVVPRYNCDHRWDGPDGFGMGGPTISCSRCGTWRAD